jgi:hypothetical protein
MRRRGVTAKPILRRAKPEQSARNRKEAERHRIRERNELGGPSRASPGKFCGMLHR